MLIIQQALFLIGGFDENNYMKTRLKRRFEPRPNGAGQCEFLDIA
jgi:hypothetical protein